MNIYKITMLFFTLITINSFSQKSGITTIKAKDGEHYLVNTIGYPITGKYLFDEGEPIVELFENGTGFYQLHDQFKRPIVWGIESFERGFPISIKGFDSEAYTLWYQYTDAESDGEWHAVEFTIHFKNKKMFIQGERMKLYSDDPKKEKKKNNKKMLSN
jgi:hypothetical protein